MKIYATSDLHGQLPDPSWVPPCDIFLIAGDVTPFHNHGIVFQLDWLHKVLRPWLASIYAKHIVWIPGNHDFVCEDLGPDSPLNAKRSIIKDLSATLLIDQGLTVDGVSIYGTPWTPTFGRWAFMRDETVLETKYAEIPQGIDILISHGPPLYHCDRNYQGLHVGSDALLRRVIEVGPKAVVCGHIHEGYGLRSVNGTNVYNVSRVNFSYQPVNPIVEIVLP